MAVRSTLRLAIRVSGLTQRELARRAYISEAHLANIIAGRKNPSLRLARRLGLLVGLPTDELFADEPHGLSEYMWGRAHDR